MNAGSTDVIRAHHGSANDDAAAPGTPGELGTPGRPASPMARRLTTTAEDANALEMRIVNKIVDIVSPRKRGRTLRLLQVGFLKGKGQQMDVEPLFVVGVFAVHLVRSVPFLPR